jgi:prenyltransferase beta subunit
MRTGFVLAAVLGLAGGSCLVAQAPNPNRATLNYLHSLQVPSGGYAPAAPKAGAAPKASVRATTSAVRALRHFGGEPRDPAAAGRFVASCFDPAAGGFGDAPDEKSNVASTAIGIMAVIELNVPQGPYRDAAVKYLSEHAKSLEEIRIAAAAFESLKMRAPRADDWLRQIAAARNPDGTFGEGAGAARTTGGTAAMILRLGGEVEHRDAVLRVMRAGQRPDGGFGTAEKPQSDLETSYRIMRAFAMMKERPADPAKLRAFIATCRNADGGYGVAAGQPSSAGGTYYAASILHWLGGH